MNEGDPHWTKEFKLTQRMLDPLALSLTSEWVTEELVPSITTTTTIARNYSFYCWAIYDTLRRNKIKKRVDFSKNLTIRESAFVIASILHDKSREKPKNPNGYDKANKILEALNNNEANVDFSVSESNPEGFYGLYYKSAMHKLGLTIRAGLFDDITPSGKKIAEAYEQNIKSTKYFKIFIDKDEVPLDVLKDYGEKCCICKLKVKSEERELLKNIFFSPNTQLLNLENSRKDTLRMMLSMIYECSQNNVDFNDDIFRDLILYSQFSDKNNIFSYNQMNFEDVWLRWKLFQLHEYFTYSIESLLHVFISRLKDKEGGVTYNDFMIFLLPSMEKLSKILEIELNNKVLSEIINLILAKFKCGNLSKESSIQFDNKCDLSSVFCERELIKKIKLSLEENELLDVAAYSFALILIGIIRIYQYISSFDEIVIWFYNKAIEDFSTLSFIYGIKDKLNELKFDDFVRYVFKFIINQHNKVAYNKQFYGNDTFRFIEHGDKYVFKRDIYPNYPQWRNSKINAIKNIFEDLNLISKQSEITVLTNDGFSLLRGRT